MKELDYPMIKHLTHYLLESEEKTYDFKIKIADIEITTEIEDQIEHALRAFDVAQISKPKRLPICNKSPEFPTLENCEVSIINASLKYPCNDAQVLQVLLTQGRLPAGKVKVVPKNNPEELDPTSMDEDETKEKDAVLTKDLETVTGGQKQVGQKRLDSMLKELESERKSSDRVTKFEKTEKVDTKSTNDLPQNNKSPVAKKGVK